LYKQVFDPVGHSLGWSALVAVLPLVTLFVLLGVLRMKAHIAALISLGVSIVVAVLVYAMPVGQAIDSGVEGAAFGIFPVLWIVVNAIWIYNITRKTGHFDILRRSFTGVSSDQRVQAVIIAFCFGALLEALAGFGTPVAICGVLLVGLGFKPMKAAAVALVANTAPVAFGAIAIPIVTLAQLTGLATADVGAMVGRQTPILSVLVPFILIGMVDGKRGLRQAWPVAAIGGGTFAVAQFVTSNFISVELSDIIASLAAAGAVVGLLRIWSTTSPPQAPATPYPAAAGASGANPGLEADIQSNQPPSRRQVLAAYAPYVIIICIFALAQIGPLKSLLDGATQKFVWPGLHIIGSNGKAPSSATFKFDFLSAAGTLLLLSGLLTMAVLRVNIKNALQAYLDTLSQLKWAIVTVMAVLALAFVMNLSGQTITLGRFAAGAGGVFALFSPLIGWFGTALTGSDTSSNSLFGVLQVSAAKNAGLSPVLLAASNSSGGVFGKMISPQNLAIGAAAVGMAGEEGTLFRQVLGWSLLMLLLMCVLAFLQSTPILSWMVV
jgi:lactate permease